MKYKDGDRVRVIISVDRHGYRKTETGTIVDVDEGNQEYHVVSDGCDEYQLDFIVGDSEIEYALGWFERLPLHWRYILYMIGGFVSGILAHITYLI